MANNQLQNTITHETAYLSILCQILIDVKLLALNALLINWF